MISQQLINRRTFFTSTLFVALTGCLGEKTGDTTEITTTTGTPSPTAEKEVTETVSEPATVTQTETPQSGTVSVEIRPGNVFRPSEVIITAGSTIEWVWSEGGHNVVVDDRPEDSEWAGHGAIEDTGYVYEHEFTAEGTYRYYCSPHRAQGMSGVVHVH